MTQVQKQQTQMLTYVQGNTDGASTYYEHETGLNQVKEVKQLQLQQI